MNYDHHYFQSLNCKKSLIPDMNSMAIYNHLSDAVYTKDPHATYCFVNKAQLKTVRFNRLEELSGKKDIELHWAQFSKVYREHDLDAMHGFQYKQLALTSTSKGKSLICLSFKKAILEEGKPIGVFCVTSIPESQELKTLSKKVPHESETPVKIMLPGDIQQMMEKKHASFSSLTLREIEVLFYFLLGKSLKTIAKIFNISVRTTSHHLDNIKQKWNCLNNESVFERAFELGYLNCVPSSLFNAHFLASLNEK